MRFLLRLLTRPVVWPVKATGYSMAAGYRTGRLFGYRRLTVFTAGVAVGLLVAPFPGKDLRALVKLRLAPTPAPPAAPTSVEEPVPAAVPREPSVAGVSDA